MEAWGAESHSDCWPCVINKYFYSRWPFVHSIRLVGNHFTSKVSVFVRACLCVAWQDVINTFEGIFPIRHQRDIITRIRLQFVIFTAYSPSRSRGTFLGKRPDHLYTKITSITAVHSLFVAAQYRTLLLSRRNVTLTEIDHRTSEHRVCALFCVSLGVDRRHFTKYKKVPKRWNAFRLRALWQKTEA